MLPIAQSTRTMGACQGRTLGAIMRLKHAVHRGAPSAAGSARSVPTTARRAAATHAAGADAGASTSTNASTSASSTVRLAIVGDVHDQWSEADARALALLAPDAVLLLGDFGNEAVALVRSIARSLAALDLPKAVILGNHDAWLVAAGPVRNHGSGSALLRAAARKQACAGVCGPARMQRPGRAAAQRRSGPPECSCCL